MGMCVYKEIEGKECEKAELLGECRTCRYWVDVDCLSTSYDMVHELDILPEDAIPEKSKEKFEGGCKIMVDFRNNAEYIKFCRYVLHTNWITDNSPYSATLDLEFHDMDELYGIMRKIVYLLQLGFKVYSANWKLATETQPIIEKGE